MTARPLPLPNLVYPGMGKAGSTLLHKLFDVHPDFFVSQIEKELGFFSKHARWSRGPDFYRTYFRGYGGQRWVADVSPGYHSSPLVAQRIGQVLGAGTKIIFTFRRFTDFAISKYLHRVRGRRVDYNLIQMIEERGRLYKPLDELAQGYVDTVGRDNVLFMQYELDFNRKAPLFEQKIYRFLGLPETSYMDRLSDDQVNAGYLPRYVFAGPEGHRETREGIDYEVPPNTIVFCNGRPYINKFVEKPNRKQLERLRAQEAAWTREFPEELYLYLQEKYAWPLAERIEKRLGLNMDHWREPRVKSVRYDPSPLPDAWIADPALRAQRIAASGGKAWR